MSRYEENLAVSVVFFISSSMRLRPLTKSLNLEFFSERTSILSGR